MCGCAMLGCVLDVVQRIAQRTSNFVVKNFSVCFVVSCESTTKTSSTHNKLLCVTCVCICMGVNAFSMYFKRCAVKIQ